MDRELIKIEEVMDARGISYRVELGGGGSVDTAIGIALLMDGEKFYRGVDPEELVQMAFSTFNTLQQMREQGAASIEEEE